MVRYCLMCTLIYKPFKTEYGEGEVLDRCIPKEGVWLWEIQATYAKQHPVSTHHVLGRTKEEALERFHNTMSWMTVTSIRCIPPGAEAELILTNRYLMPTG